MYRKRMQYFHFGLKMKLLVFDFNIYSNLFILFETFNFKHNLVCKFKLCR